MPKDTYYFTHDYHARNDPKMDNLIQALGAPGVGIYWCLVEMLYEEGGELKKTYLPALAKKLRVRLKTIEKVISNFDLFQETDDLLWANSINRRLTARLAKTEKARISANLRS